MTPDQWQHIRDLMESALEVEAKDRTAYLDRTCKGDSGLRQEVDSLLSAFDGAGEFLDKPVLDLQGPVPDSFAGYRVLRELGQGGMGSVYLAHSEGDGGSLVAIKVAHQGLPPGSQRRFRIEHQILTRLQHPRIAGVIDVGTTDQGRPYFVMDYVDGKPIDSYCNEKSLTIEARLDLFLQVCDAVEVAHGQGVVHRDLKPSNILVTADGVPWLLDFGIAKLLDPEQHTFSIEATQTEERLLTPQFASPEQIYGEKITRRSDVYSLGVVLYKLLTGRLPIELERYSLRGMARAFEVQSPQRPSDISAAPRLGMASRISTDLDKVVLKAIRFTSRDRYFTVQEFAQDVAKCVAGKSPSAVQRADIFGFITTGSRPRTIGLLVMVFFMALYVAWSMTQANSRDRRVQEIGLSLAPLDDLAVGEFKNLTQEPIYDAPLSHAFQLGFEISPHFTIHGRRHLRAAMMRMQRDPAFAVDRASGVEICRHEDIEALVLGSLTQKGDGFLISVEVVNPRYDTVFSRQLVEVTDENDLISAMGIAISNTRVAIGEPRSVNRETPRLGEATTENFKAFRSYALAMEKDLGIDNDEQEVARLLTRALDIDPGFALAKAHLAKMHNDLFIAGSSNLLKEALASSRKFSFYDNMKYRAHHSFWDGSWADMFSAYSRMAQRFPHDFVAQLQFGEILFRFEGNPQEAAPIFEVASRLAYDAPSFEYSLRFLIESYVALEDHQQIERTLRRFPGQSQGNIRLQARVLNKMLKQDMNRTGLILEELELMQQDNSNVNLVQPAMFLADRGLLSEALEKADIPYNRTGVMALSVMMNRHANERWIEELIRTAPEILQGRDRGRNHIYFSTWAILVKIFARHGALKEARILAQGFKPLIARTDFPIWRSYGRMLQGEIHLAEGRLPEALKEFEKGLETHETFQIHESLAEVHERLGQFEKALVERQWLIDHRGLALVQAGTPTSVVQNVIYWNLAYLRIGRLHEELGHRDKAVEAYLTFLQQWEGNDPPSFRADAELGLRRLQE